MLLGSLSCHNKDLEWRTLKPPQRVTALGSWTDHVIALRSRTDHVIARREISVTALFYLEDSRKIHLRGMRASWSKDVERRAPPRAGESEGASPLAPLFICFFFPGACPMQIGLRQERCSTWSPHSGPRIFLWPSSVLFSRGFPLPFSHRHFGLLFPILTT